MSAGNYVFGPVPSRRLGRSLGISPLPQKTCNYSCIYCQLGRTDKMTNTRKTFFPTEEILEEFKLYLKDQDKFDVVSIVGEGEPTLCANLGQIIRGVHALCDKPVAVITNAALMGDASVRADLALADIVLPSLDSCDETAWHRVDRPHGHLDYGTMMQGLIQFSREYTGQLFLEVMLMKGVNDDEESLLKLRDAAAKIRSDRVYVNTPVRPPAEADVQVSSPETIARACELLGGISIDALAAGSFFSEIPDDYQAILSIIGRHPMNQHEIGGFLESRNNANPESIFEKLRRDPGVAHTEYKGYVTYRLK